MSLSSPKAARFRLLCATAAWPCLVAVGACHSAERPSADTTAKPPSAAVAAAPQAITGKTWDVKMTGDATAPHFEPASLTIHTGDGVRFTVVATPPHNVTFWPDSIPSGAQGSLEQNMTNVMAPMTGPILTNIGDTYTVSFAGAPAGTYHYYCTPHLALGMKGVIIVQ